MLFLYHWYINEVPKINEIYTAISTLFRLNKKFAGANYISYIINSYRYPNPHLHALTSLLREAEVVRSLPARRILALNEVFDYVEMRNDVDILR